MKSTAYKKVFAGKAIEAHFIKQMLEEHGIVSLVKDDPLGQLFPLFVASGELRPVRIYVENDKYAQALDWIKIYTSSKSKADRKNHPGKKGDLPA